MKLRGKITYSINNKAIKKGANKNRSPKEYKSFISKELGVEIKKLANDIRSFRRYDGILIANEQNSFRICYNSGLFLQDIIKYDMFPYFFRVPCYFLLYTKEFRLFGKFLAKSCYHTE